MHVNIKLLVYYKFFEAVFFFGILVIFSNSDTIFFENSELSMSKT